MKRVLKIMPEKELRLEVMIFRFNDSKTSHSFTIVSVLLLHVTFTTIVLSPMNVTFNFNHPKPLYFFSTNRFLNLWFKVQLGTKKLTSRTSMREREEPESSCFILLDVTGTSKSQSKSLPKLKLLFGVDSSSLISASSFVSSYCNPCM